MLFSFFWIISGRCSRFGVGVSFGSSLLRSRASVIMVAATPATKPMEVQARMIATRFMGQFWCFYQGFNRWCRKGVWQVLRERCRIRPHLALEQWEEHGEWL